MEDWCLASSLGKGGDSSRINRQVFRCRAVEDEGAKAAGGAESRLQMQVDPTALAFRPLPAQVPESTSQRQKSPATRLSQIWELRK